MNRLRRFVLNGSLMALVALIVRTVSVSFNVYISNKIGAVAMGLFSLIGTVYGFCITFATSGINLATTRLVAKALGDTADNEPLSDERISALRCTLRRCIAYAVFFGSIATVILWCFAESIGTGALRDARTVSSLRVLSVTLLPIALSSVLGGYFSAMRKAAKNACVLVIGQGVKIYACIALLAFFGANDTESACLAVVCGGAVAELAAFLLNCILYFSEKRKRGVQISAKQKREARSELLKNALPVAFSAYMRSALVTIEHILIPPGLEKSGASRDGSLAAYGILGSMVLPLVLFPSAISASFAGLLIPEVAESVGVGDQRRIRGIVCTVMETVLIFSIGCAGVMMSFSLELGATVYPEAEDAGKYILLIAPLVPVMYLDTAVDSMLKGLGEQVYTMWVNIADASISVVLVTVLLPRMGIYGYIVTVYFTEILNATLSITRLLLKSGARARAIVWIARPLICVIASTRLTQLLIRHIALGGVWTHITIASAGYILLMIACGGIKISRIVDRTKYIFKVT